MNDIMTTDWIRVRQIRSAADALSWMKAYTCTPQDGDLSNDDITEILANMTMESLDDLVGYWDYADEVFIPDDMPVTPDVCELGKPSRDFGVTRGKFLVLVNDRRYDEPPLVVITWKDSGLGFVRSDDWERLW